MSRTHRGPNRKGILSKRGRHGWRRWKTKGRKANAIGRELEERVSIALEALLTSGEIDVYRAYPPHSAKDQEGVDFAVVRNGECVEFDVTSSYRSWKKKEAARATGRAPSLHFSQKATTEYIGKQVLGLFAQA